MSHEDARPGEWPVVVRVPVEPVEAAVEADARDAALHTNVLAVRGPLFGVMAQSEGDGRRWRVVVEVTHGGPQEARDGLNSLLWFRAKDDTDDRAERRALLKAVARLESERVDELTVLGHPLPRGEGRGVHVHGRARRHRTAAAHRPRTPLPHPGGGAPVTALPRLYRDQVPRLRTARIGAGRGESPRRPAHARAVQDHGTDRRRALVDGQRPACHRPRGAPNPGLRPGLVGAPRPRPDPAELAVLAEAADRIRAERLNEIEVDGTVSRIGRIRRLLRWGHDGPEGPRPSDVDNYGPSVLHPQLDEDGTIHDEDSEDEDAAT